MKIMNFGEFEKKAGVVFKDKTLLKQAFTHRSFLNENPKKGLEHNERLEFLGDAVLELSVTRHLFDRFPQKTEGDLTAYRAALVNTHIISKAASELDMNAFLLLSKGEAQDTGKARQYILANTFEALVGALYLDQGYSAAEQFISRNLYSRLDEILKEHSWQDPKSDFQEKAQEILAITPQYKLIGESGPDHAKNFIMGVFLDNNLIAQGEGRSKQEAEQDAATKALLKKQWSTKKD